MTDQIAALPMYDWPEVRAATDAQWARIRDVLRKAGIDAPETLTRETGDLHDFWRRPDLFFAQTCWGPMGDGLADHVHVIGQPDYSDVQGGEGEFYRSVILMRIGDLDRRLSPGGIEGGSAGQPALIDLLVDMIRDRRFAYNAPDSMSGYLALTADLGSLDMFAEQIPTGGHRASIRAVAANRADVCTIDCRTWALAKLHEPDATDLMPIGWTTPRKGLPYITGNRTPPETATAMRAALLETGVILAAG